MTARRRVIAHHPPRRLAGRKGGRPVTADELRYLAQVVEAAAAAVVTAREGATQLLGPGSPVGHAVLDALLALGEAREMLEKLTSESEEN